MEVFRSGLSGGGSPEVDREFARGGHGEFAASGASERVGDQAFGRRVTRLPPNQSPDKFDQQVTHAGVAVAVDVAIASGAAALVAAGAQAGLACNLASVFEAVLVADFALQQYSGQSADSFGQGLRRGGFELGAELFLLGFEGG